MQHALPTRRHRSALEIRQLLARFRKSGLSQVQFARQEGLCLSSRQRYLKRSSILPTGAPPAFTSPPKPRGSSQVDFVEVDHASPLRFHAGAPQLHPPVSPRAGFYRVALASGAALEIPTGFCPQEAEFLLRLATNSLSR